MKLSPIYRIFSTFLSVLLLWNLCSWWISPVVETLFFHTDISGIECCNGAEICCCKAGGADRCYCLPNFENPEIATKNIVCGISVPDSHPNAQENGTLVFFDFRALISQTEILKSWCEHEIKHIPLNETRLTGFYSDLLRPPKSHLAA